MIKLKGYISSRKINNNSIPQHIQNIVLREYCKRNNFFFILSDSEYSINNSYSVLDGMIKSCKEYNGIIFYSIFQLPLDKQKRNKILNNLLKQKKQAHFAQENYIIKNINEIEKIGSILDITEKLDENLNIDYLRKLIN